MAVKSGKVVKTVLAIVGVLVIAVASIAGVNVLLTDIERKTYTAPGRLVDVNGGTMHVYSEGNGEKKVVLLSGFGTTCPVLDFQPLVRALSDSCTVIVVEYFGYGWSDGTDRARTAEAVVEETRGALARAGFAPPYILVPHSLSGLYALQYAGRYPDEVEAVVGLDIAVPRQFDFSGKPSVPTAVAFLREAGLIRIATLLFPAMAMIPSADDGVYTPEEINLIRIMACRNTFNSTMLGEARAISRNSETLPVSTYPREIPAVMIVASRTVEKIARMGWKTDWKTLHREVVAGNTDGRVIVLEGEHYIHRTRAREIGDIVKSFLD